MSTAVHHISMYAHQSQGSVGSTLAAVVTKVTGGPATFNGLAPTSKAELDKYSVAADFGGSAAAWATNQWVDLGSRYYRWNGTAWVTLGLATGVSTSVTPDAELVFTGGRAPKSETQLNASAFGQTAAWAVEGQYVTLGGVGSGGDQYYWDGDSWVLGTVPA